MLPDGSARRSLTLGSTSLLSEGQKLLLQSEMRTSEDVQFSKFEIAAHLLVVTELANPEAPLLCEGAILSGGAVLLVGSSTRTKEGMVAKKDGQCLDINASQVTERDEPSSISFSWRFNEACASIFTSSSRLPQETRVPSFHTQETCSH